LPICGRLKETHSSETMKIAGILWSQKKCIDSIPTSWYVIPIGDVD
jgi:hypothetical protein